MKTLLRTSLIVLIGIMLFSIGFLVDFRMKPPISDPVPAAYTFDSIYSTAYGGYATSQQCNDTIMVVIQNNLITRFILKRDQPAEK